MPSPYRASEDSTLAAIGSGCSVDTNTAHSRLSTNWTRCALLVQNNGYAALDFGVWRLPAALGLSASNFWFTAYFYNLPGNSAQQPNNWLSFLSTGDVERLIIRSTVTGLSLAVNWVIQKKTAAGALTTLATFNAAMPFNGLARIDIQVNYLVAGNINVYLTQNAVTALVASFSGDVTTDGVTALTGYQLGCPDGGGIGSNGLTAWSEIITDPNDTRRGIGGGLWTQGITGAGNATQWPNGTYVDVNEVVLNDSLSINTNTANQLDEFTIGAPPSGNFGVIDATIHARAAAQSGAPGDLDTVWRTGSPLADYPNPDHELTAALSPYWDISPTNPATSAAWQMSDFTNAGFNIGVKSIA